ncbi:MAG: FAD binding domain-containing protein [Spirochaetales bacterium]|nr:FAD binding domain-containing protein [Spirochaetales bacterium]
MPSKHTAPRTYFPRTIAEALDIHASQQGAVFWAGGTHLAQSSHNRRYIDLPRVVVSLGRVEELARASRSEEGLELGSMMSLDRLDSIGRNALPLGLPEALAHLGSRPLRCRATIGGHIAMRDRMGDLTGLLQLLDTQIETRYLKLRRGRRKPAISSRKLSLSQLNGPEGLQDGELIVRLSIPHGDWTHGFALKIPVTGNGRRQLNFYALARVDKNVLNQWRMALSDGQSGILRDRDLEVAMAGKPLPLSKRDMDALEGSVEHLTRVWENRPCEREIAQRLTRGILTDIST